MRVYAEGQRVQVKNPDGPGWIVAKYGEAAPDQPKWIANPGVNPGVEGGGGYWVDQAWVVYQEGDREGTSGLHPINKEIRPEGRAP